jgi:ferric-dicitrate binding protein FerR (iron transport regulator)
MNCCDATKLVEALVEGRLDADSERRLHAHCGACPDCARALDEGERFSALLGGSFRSARPDRSVKPRIMAQITAGAPLQLPARRPWRGVAALAAGAVAAAVLLGVMYSMLAPPQHDSEPAGTASIEPEPGTRVPEKLPPRQPEEPRIAPRVTEPRRIATPATIEPKTHAPVVTPDATPAVVGRVVSGTFELKKRDGSIASVSETDVELHLGDTLLKTGEEAGQIALSDRVLVAVDAGSIVATSTDATLPFDLRLDRGQVFAEVLTGTPFRVLTADGDVQSLGTKFGVSLSNAGQGATELSVTVEEGVVEVQRDRERQKVKSGSCVSMQRDHAMRHCGNDAFQRRMAWVHRHRARRGHGSGGMGGGHGYGRRSAPGQQDTHPQEGREHGQDQGHGQRHGHGQGHGQGQGQGQGQGHGQGQGQGPGQDPGQGQGRGRGRGRGGRR